MLFQKANLKFFLDIAKDYWRSYYSDGYCLTRKFFLKGRQLKNGEFFTDRLHFEVTNLCNLRCRYCLYSKKPPQKLGIMPFDIFKKAIDEFNEMGGEVVGFTPIVGEPLLDPGLVAKIEYAKSLPKIKEIYFFTNGTLLLKDENYKKLIDSGIQTIEISISATDEPTFIKMQQVGIEKADLYKNTIEGIHKLLQYNREKGNRTKIGINFRSPVLPSKVLSSRDFQRYLKPFLDSGLSYDFMAGYDNWCGNIGKRDLRGIMRLKRINKFKYLPCVRIYDVAVLFDGSIRLCCHRIKDNEFNELVVGNIRQNSLKEIFSSEKVEKLSNSFFAGNVPSVCKNCNLYAPVAKI